MVKPKIMPIFEIFSAPSGTYGNALINWKTQSANEIVDFAASYRYAAMNLVSFREQRGAGTIDHGALPILFLYRHSFELYLKAMVYRAAVLSINDDELVRALPRLWREHSLMRLLQMSAPVLQASSSRPLVQSGDLQRQITTLASKIDDIDPGSYSFRYPVNSKGDSALPKYFLTNIFVFADEMEGVLDELSQFCRELEAERLQTSPQMKLALHLISDGAAE
ncbi:MAG TPA: hypothetical protein DCK83_05755 [Gallionellaceae bacterium]|nr:hypothetical protein [Gallionellaceae bacterium]